jgi:hypothetical protein
LDQALKDGDGTLLRDRLRERGIPFVIYSGFADEPDVVNGGAVIPKPVPSEVLITTVEALLPDRPNTVN